MPSPRVRPGSRVDSTVPRRFAGQQDGDASAPRPFPFHADRPRRPGLSCNPVDIATERPPHGNRSKEGRDSWRRVTSPEAQGRCRNRRTRRSTGAASSSPASSRSPPSAARGGWSPRAEAAPADTEAFRTLSAFLTGAPDLDAGTRRARLRPAHRARRGASPRRPAPSPRRSRPPTRRRWTISWRTRLERPRPPRHRRHHRLGLVPRLHRHADLAPRRGRHRLRHLHRGAACTRRRWTPPSARPTPAPASTTGSSRRPSSPRRRCRPASSRGAANRRKASARSPQAPATMPEDPPAAPPSAPPATEP